MKNINNFLIFLCFGFLTTTMISAQSAYEAEQTTTWMIGKFKVKKVDFSFGFESDYIQNMDYEFFVKQIPDVQQARLNELNFRPEDYESAVCENPSFNLGLTLLLPKYKNIEWRSAFAFKPNRVDAITYYNNSRYEGQYMNINGTHNEFTVETALVYKIPILSFFNLYTGVGTNLGITSANHTCVYSSLDLTAKEISYTNIDEITAGVPAGLYGSGDGYNECFNTGTQMNQRVFVQIGTGLKFFQRVEVGFDIKYGFGYRTDIGQTVDGTHIVATNLNIRYILK